MKRVLTAIVLVPLVLLVVFKAPLWLFSLVVGVLVLLSLHEYLGIVKGYGIEPARWPLYVVSVLIVVATFWFYLVRSEGSWRRSEYFWFPAVLHLIVLVGLPLVFGISLVFRRELQMGLAASSCSAFGILYITVPLSLLIALRWAPGASILVIYILLAVWVGDIAAYYVGKTIGRHKLAPLVSPNKTWEGAIASLIASIAVVRVILYFAPSINGLFGQLGHRFRFDNFSDDQDPLAFLLSNSRPLLIYLLGIVANVAAQFGDLFESAIKRGAQIKDSGSLLPGHGGILDRIDALLFAIPAVWYYAALISLFS